MAACTAGRSARDRRTTCACASWRPRTDRCSLRQAVERPQGDDEHADEHGGDVESPDPRRQSDRCGAPQRSGGRQPARLAAGSEDRPASEEPDAGHDLRRDPRRIGLTA
jgi:hypothetical protein